MKVLISAYACEPNKGSEPGVGWNWATRLSKHCEVVVITRANNQPSIEEAIKKDDLQNIKFYYFDVPGVLLEYKNKILGGVSLYYKLWQKKVLEFAVDVQKEEKCDVVHHITYNEFRTPGQMYKLNIPYVWGPIGGGQLYNPIFHKAYFSSVDILFEKIRNWYTLFSGRNSKGIRVVKETAAAIIIADCSTAKLLNIPTAYRLFETAYDLTRNEIKSSYENQGKLQLLWVGNIIPRKGLKLLIEALGESNFRNFELSIIGGGKDKKKCMNLVEHYGLEKYVTFYGKMNYDRVNQMYDNADLFLFTSLRDTSGNVVIEAMSHGVPTIGFNHHGVSEIVTKETGVLIPVDNYDSIKKSIVNAIIEFDNNRDLIETKGRLARTRIEECFSWDTSIAKMLQIYIDIISQRVLR